MIGLQHLRSHPIQHAGAEGAPALTVFDLLIDPVSNPLGIGRAEDRSVTQRTRTKLHPPLKPGHRVTIGQQLCRPLRHLVDPLPAGFFRMLLAGLDALLGGIAGAEIGVRHRLNIIPQLIGHIGGGTDGSARIGGGRLHKKLFHIRPADDALVQLHIQRHTPSKADLAAIFQDIAEIMVDQAERDLFQNMLDAGGIVDVGVVDCIPFTLWSQPLDQLGAEVVTLAVAVLIAPQANYIDQLGVDLETALIKGDQPGEIKPLRVAIGRHPHHLELSIQHLKPQILGHRPVEAAE